MIIYFCCRLSSSLFSSSSSSSSCLFQFTFTLFFLLFLLYIFFILIFGMFCLLLFLLVCIFNCNVILLLQCMPRVSSYCCCTDCTASAAASARDQKMKTMNPMSMNYISLTNALKCSIIACNTAHLIEQDCNFSSRVF